MSLFWILVAILVIFILLTLNANKPDGGPPGPFKFPIIGNMWVAMQSPGGAQTIHLLFTNLAKKWGDIYSLQFGSMPMVIINNPVIFREAFSGKDHPFIIRWMNKCAYQFGKGTSAGFNRTKERWAYMRKMSAPMVKSLPNGVPHITVIKEETEKLLKVFEGSCSKGGLINEVRIHEDLAFHARNMILRMYCSESWEHGQENWDIEVHEICEAMHESLPNTSSIADFLPFLEPFAKQTRSTFGRAVEAIKAFHRRKATQRLQTPLPDIAEARDFLDVLLLEERDNGLTDESAGGTVCELFYGGYNVADSIEWAILYLCVHQDMQEIAHKEVSDFLKGDWPSSMADQSRMPYLGAVIKEVFRIRPTVPIGIPRIADRDCMIAGYKIKKNTGVSGNIFAMHHSEEIFENPYKFDPSRWLAADANEKYENIVNFLYGPATCLGITIAKMEVFFALSVMLQRFRFELAPSNPNPDLTGETNFAFHPAKWYTVITRRQ